MNGVFFQSMSFFFIPLINFFRSCDLVSGLLRNVDGRSFSKANCQFVLSMYFSPEWNASGVSMGLVSLYFFLQSTVILSGSSLCSILQSGLTDPKEGSTPTSCLKAFSITLSAVNSSFGLISISLAVLFFLSNQKNGSSYSLTPVVGSSKRISFLVSPVSSSSYILSSISSWIILTVSLFIYLNGPQQLAPLPSMKFLSFSLMISSLSFQGLIMVSVY